ncbi:MAG TPA: DUF3501 family protein [Alphaproteobacteria bacterium]|jgi:hypothetical protein
MATGRRITRDDIMDMESYAKLRAEERARINALKQDRRLEVGPFATFYFENFDTMRHQIHEMLFVERGGEAQLADELNAYNPLVPQGRELVATLMFEIEDAARRDRELRRLGFVERTVTLAIDGEEVKAVAEGDVERTKPDGARTSSVHFLHFPLTDAQAARFKTPGAKVVLAINHENYGHAATMPERVRAALAGDLA